MCGLGRNSTAELTVPPSATTTLARILEQNTPHNTRHCVMSRLNNANERTKTQPAHRLTWVS